MLLKLLLEIGSKKEECEKARRASRLKTRFLSPKKKKKKKIICVFKYRGRSIYELYSLL